MIGVFPISLLLPLYSLSPMSLPILTVFKLHAKGCEVCASELDGRTQKTQNYATLTGYSDRHSNYFDNLAGETTLRY